MLAHRVSRSANAHLFSSVLARWSFRPDTDNEYFLLARDEDEEEVQLADLRRQQVEEGDIDDDDDASGASGGVGGGRSVRDSAV